MIRHCNRTLAQGLVLLAVILFASPPSVRAAGLSDETLEVDGQQRRFLVHDFSRQQKAPLVIVLHGGGGSGENAALQTGFDAIAEREQLIAVYPYGSGRFANTLLTWNAGHCCSYALEQQVDDIHFISELIDDMVARHNVDAARVYVTGLSNGGMMTHRIGIELGHKVAAIAPVIASTYGDEPLRNIAMPTLIINGADDQIVRVDGGELGGIGSQLGGADGPFLPVAAQATYWAEVNDCQGFVATATATYQKFTYACGEGTAVERYLVIGNGHAWPGGTAPRPDADQPVQTFSANEVIWNFFKRFTREPAAGTAQQPYYYDGNLHIPALTHQAQVYSAQLQITREIPPLEFELKRIRTDGNLATMPGLSLYDAGTLYVPGVQVGAQRYQAWFTLTGNDAMKFRLDSLNLQP